MDSSLRTTHRPSAPPSPGPRHRDGAAEGSHPDLLRQITGISAACFMLIAALVGAGVLGGTPVQDLQGGALGEDGSYLAPASGAFRIWSVIYVGLAAYTIWQALPSQRTDERQRVVGWCIALTMVLNGLWLVAAQFFTLWLTVLVIVLLLIVLAVTFQRAVSVPPRKWTDALLIDGVTGLHLGWVTLATVANTSAWLTQLVPDAWAAAAAPIGVFIVGVVGIIGIGIGLAGRGRIAPLLALAWGLCWLAVGRVTGEPPSMAIGIAAIVVAVIVLIPPVVILARNLAHPHRSSAGPVAVG